jgi:hypothetical protein
VTKREGDGSLDRGACAIRITRPRARASPLGHRLNCDPAGAMRGRDGAGERKAGARRKGVIRGLVFRTFSFPICVGFVKKSRGGGGPVEGGWRRARGQSSSRGRDTPSSEGVGARSSHTRVTHAA